MSGQFFTGFEVPKAKNSGRARKKAATQTGASSIRNGSRDNQLQSQSMKIML